MDTDRKATFEQQIAEIKADRDYLRLIEAVPYARTIGMGCQLAGDEVIYTLPRVETNIGNPTLPAIHGGVLGGFMEQSAIMHALMHTPSGGFPRVIDLSIDYLSAALYRDSFAICETRRMGKRIANIVVTVWQHNREEPVCSARANLLLV